MTTVEHANNNTPLVGNLNIDHFKNAEVGPYSRQAVEPLHSRAKWRLESRKWSRSRFPTIVSNFDGAFSQAPTAYHFISYRLDELMYLQKRAVYE